MGRKKEAKEKKQRGSSRSAFSSRPGLELTASQVDPPGSSAGGSRVCLCHHWGEIGN